MSVALIKKDLRAAIKRPGKNVDLQRFFKTGKGQYGEGDVFLGVTVPNQRAIARRYADSSLTDLQALLKSKYHEERLTAIFILVGQFERGSDVDRKKIYNFYLENTDRVNNWDLVDSSAHKIVGVYLYEYKKPREILYKLAKSKSLWDQRISVIATLYFIQRGDLDDIVSLAKIHLSHPHDLIHKAVGWMLREMGKRDINRLETFLKANAHTMPRTMLRYAIEKLPDAKRKRYMSKKA